MIDKNKLMKVAKSAGFDIMFDKNDKKHNVIYEDGSHDFIDPSFENEDFEMTESYKINVDNINEIRFDNLNTLPSFDDDNVSELSIDMSSLINNKDMESGTNHIFNSLLIGTDDINNVDEDSFVSLDINNSVNGENLILLNNKISGSKAA